VLAQSADRPARQILVNVDAFDVWPTGRCVLVADWTIVDADRRAWLATDRGTFTTAAAGANLGDGAIVTAMADAVRQLADRIASTAEALSRRAGAAVSSAGADAMPAALLADKPRIVSSH
jgi:uncharacterized lipoprotein YmbA